ncbi:immunity 49 family protein [Nocardia concava]|uniref:immunity 49 family protein n=1 Tax=Nocardia concava TaxID=257281 RepID=UPI001427ED1A|nr:immunity 49 family protein [Nocardia concava]
MASKVETWQAYVQVMQASSAIFAIATAAEGMVEIRFGERILMLPAGSTQGIADAGNWVTAFYYAVMGRDQARLTMLSEVPTELLRAAGSVYWSEGAGLPEKLRATFNTTDPANVRHTPSDLLLRILYPPIDLFYRFLDEQWDEFNSSLAQALQSHDAYWDSGEDDRRDNRTGMIAAGPLAMTCLALDADFPVDVESDYLPRHVVQRSWLGEFPT